MTYLTKVLSVTFFTIALLTIFFLSRFVTAGITSGDKIKTNSVNRKYRIDGTATKPEQIPICMIGDSITWAQLGDNWRKLLLEHIFPIFHPLC